MLVLSRKESERIRVGESIVVTVVRLTKDRVRLGIEAPDDVLVLRDELEKEGEAKALPMPERETVPVRKAPLRAYARKTVQEEQNMAATSCCAVAEEEPAKNAAANPNRQCPVRKYFRWNKD